jgi:hypothetical protein
VLPVDRDLEMEVRAGRGAGLADVADEVADLDRVADLELRRDLRRHGAAGLQADVLLEGLVVGPVRHRLVARRQDCHADAFYTEAEKAALGK